MACLNEQAEGVLCVRRLNWLGNHVLYIPETTRLFASVTSSAEMVMAEKRLWAHAYRPDDQAEPAFLKRDSVVG